ncbi:MAG: deoxyribodipyrimidine photo-lyase [Pseudomonadota bacterium]
MNQTTAIVWFRRDLRLADHPALSDALARFDRVVCLYVYCPTDAWPIGGASRWWLHHSLAALAQSLKIIDGELVLLAGNPLAALREVIDASGATAVFWHDLHEPAERARDQDIEQALGDDGIEIVRHNGLLLNLPGSVRTGSDGVYRVFTPFWKALRARLDVPKPLPAPLSVPTTAIDLGVTLEALQLLPRIDWAQGMRETWQPGEAGANLRARQFTTAAIDHYDHDRDLPGVDGVSMLSPHLHFGEISVRTVWHLTLARPDSDGVRIYQTELGWREFAHEILAEYPHTPNAPMNRAFERFPWQPDNEVADLIEAWRHGRTGIPIVDAGMRQLWHTGWMHNRVRMIVASFLVKNIRAHWLHGARWFWDTLVDANLPANTMGWQWSAGSGADAAPYFRIFNPVRQGERFDADGAYVRRWVPEVAGLPDKYVHAPWTVPAALRQQLGFIPGDQYPEPIVDLSDSRKAALAAFSAMKEANA